MTENVSKKTAISIVVPCYNEEDNVTVLWEKVRKSLPEYKPEFIFVDDGSSDATLRNLHNLAQKDNLVKFISFSRNFGHQAALRAGLRHATGQAVISMDADLQHPPELLPTLIQKWQDGNEVVYTVRKDTRETGWVKRATSHLFYRIMNVLTDFKVEEGAADFRLLDRKVIEVINAQEESDLFLRGYIGWLGFRQLGVPYAPAKRFSGKSKYTFKKMFKLATHGMTQFSVKPLRLTIVMGIVFAVLGALYGIYALVQHFVSRNVTSGWTSLIVIVLITSGIQLILLGIVGEYVGKTFMQTKNRPDYIVKESNI